MLIAATKQKFYFILFFLQLIGPLSEEEVFGEADWNMLYNIESEMYAAKLVSLVEGLSLRNLSPDEDTSTYRSNLVIKIASLLRRIPQRNRLSQLPALSQQHRFVVILISRLVVLMSILAVFFIYLLWIQTCF